MTETTEMPIVELSPEEIQAVNNWLPQKFAALQRAAVELEICVVLGNPVNFNRARGYLLATLNELTQYLNALGEKNGKSEKHQSEEEDSSGNAEEQSGDQTQQEQSSGIII